MHVIAPDKPLPALIVITSNESLLQLEAGDALRKRAVEQGFTEHFRYVMDSRSNWSVIFEAGASGSLFGDRQLLEITLPSGKPGKAGADALVRLAEQVSTHAIADDLLTIIKLPSLDRATRESRWAKALLGAATVVDLPDIQRSALPAWIGQRLATQNQQLPEETLQWLADRVEGNLLAAHQEIQKLGLLYPEGQLTQEQCQNAVMNVARYDVFDLRDAMLEGDATRMLRVLWGLKAEGEALPLVLWAVGEEIRTLSRIQQLVDSGQDLSSALRANRVFSTRERRVRQALRRVHPKRWRRAVAHAHDIDRLIKGIPVSTRLTDPWQEMARLALSVAAGRSG